MIYMVLKKKKKKKKKKHAFTLFQKKILAFNLLKKNNPVFWQKKKKDGLTQNNPTPPPPRKSNGPFLISNIAFDATDVNKKRFTHIWQAIFKRLLFFILFGIDHIFWWHLLKLKAYMTQFKSFRDQRSIGHTAHIPLWKSFSDYFFVLIVV